jgi:hypothetical protein
MKARETYNTQINLTQNSVGGFSQAACLRGLFISLYEENILKTQICSIGCLLLNLEEEKLCQ